MQKKNFLAKWLLIKLSHFCIIVHNAGNQLVPQLLLKQYDTLFTQYRHIEHLHEEDRCQKVVLTK